MSMPQKTTGDEFKAFSASGTADSILKACEEYKAKIHAAEIARKKGTRKAVVFLVITILLGVTFFFLITIPFCILFLILTIREFRLLPKVPGEPARRKLNMFMELVNTFGEDIPKEAPCRVLIDLQGYLSHPAPQNGTHAQNAAKKYLHSWLTFSGRFHDGNRFRLRAFIRVKRREKQKRSYKKVRESAMEGIALLLRVNDKTYTQSGKVLELLKSGTALKPDFTVVRSSGENGVLRLVARTQPYERLQGRFTAPLNDGEVKLNRNSLVLFFTSLYAVLQNLR